MYSDSEDEDELLQMALKEQTQRDLNYQRPPSSGQRKPVENFVQSPKPMLQKSAANQQLQKHENRRVVEEDDDSEVEMLSISSGDEAVGEDRDGARGRGGRGGGGGRASAEYDRSWDGEEPAYWKHVNEAELARRVHDMRETRTAPVAQKYETRPSTLGERVLNNLQSFPCGMECIDPLGLGIIDNRTLRLITVSSESSPSKSDKDHLDGNLHEKLLYFSEKFDSKLFLSRIHQDTSSADLEAGALALKTDLKGRTQERKQLVKDNFDCFVSCKTTIDDIESKLKRIEEAPEGCGTSYLYNCMQGVTSLANHAFEPLFERQAQAEKIRSVQGMFQRFRTLFNLPSTIRGSISKGEYDFALREYKKAKSIALPSHVGILKRVLEEVDKVMHEFKGTLYKSMEDPQIDLTIASFLLENTVRLLLELEPDSDPVWHYLNIQNHRIRGLLEKCTLDHESRMETLHNEMHERALSDATWRQIQQRSDNDKPLSMEVETLPLDSQLIEMVGEEVDVLLGRYIRRLSAVLIHHIPAFWKVVVSVFSGKFAKSSHVTTESNLNNSANKTEEKVGDGRYSTHSVDEVAAMICNTISAYEIKVQSAFRALEESNVLKPYMSDAIEDVSKACQAFEAKESAPPSAVMALRTLQAELSKLYIFRLCSWMRAMTEEISKEETLVPVSVLERNKSPYAISYLPLAFRSLISLAMDQISLMIQKLRSEARKSEDIFLQLQEIQESVRVAFLNSFLDFAGHLEHIGTELVHKKSGDSLHLQNGFSNESNEKLSSNISGSVVDPHQQLLMVLSNIGYCKEYLSRELYKKYKSIWLQSRDKDDEDSDVKDLVTSFSGLEEKVLEQYTFAKANVIRTAAVNYLLNAGVQWGEAPAVKGMRDVAVELLHTLVAVHSEVFTSAKPLLDKALGILIEGLVETFLSLLHENKSKDLQSLDANGFCQLMLELEYFEAVFSPYFTPDARESLKSLQGILLEKATENVAEVIENPGHQRRSTRGSEDALADDRQPGLTVSPDDLIALARQCSGELLQNELERTRINTACFAEPMPLDLVPEPAKATYAFKGSMESRSRNYNSSQTMGSPGFSQQRC